MTKDSEIIFSSNSGELRVGNDPKHRLRMDFPLLKARSSHISPALVEGLGAYPDEVYLGTNCLCVFGEEETVASLEPDFKILSGLDSCLGVIVTARTAKIGYHFVSRYFAPSVGINEDHATGSAHCFRSLREKKLGKEKLVAYQASPGRGNQMRAQGRRGHSFGCGRDFRQGQDEVLRIPLQKMGRLWASHPVLDEWFFWTTSSSDLPGFSRKFNEIISLPLHKVFSEQNG